jgi:GT2 family glycosyltransferase
VCATASERPRTPATALPPLVVAVVNWNGRRHLADCLGSLLANGYDPLRLVLVDNGSGDDSVAFVRDAFPQVDVMPLTANLRWAGGNNVVIRMLRQEGVGDRHLLLLNNDTIVPPGQLESLVRRIASDPHAWAGTPRICYANDPSRVWYDGGRVGAVTGWISHAGIRRRLDRLDPRPRFVDYGTGCALLLTPHALEEVGDLDERYYFYGEDVDYCLRLRAAGGRILHVPQALVLHKVSAALGGDSPRKAYLRSRSHVMLLRQHWPRSRWPLLALTQALYYGGTTAWHLCTGRRASAWAFWRGLSDELRGKEVRSG